MGTLNCMHDPMAILREEELKTFEKQSYCLWTESDKSATLHAQAGQVGTGGIVLLWLNRRTLWKKRRTMW